MQLLTSHVEVGERLIDSIERRPSAFHLFTNLCQAHLAFGNHGGLCSYSLAPFRGELVRSAQFIRQLLAVGAELVQVQRALLNGFAIFRQAPVEFLQIDVDDVPAVLEPLNLVNRAGEVLLGGYMRQFAFMGFLARPI